MRFHLVSLPHTQATAEYSACAFTMKVRGFARMMKDRGHTVILYAGEEHDTPADELVTCITERQRAKAVGDGHYTQASFEGGLLHWKVFNFQVVENIQERYQPGDFVCIIGGAAQRVIVERLASKMFVVEFGIGYAGTCAPYRVFESYAWMHSVYAAGKWNAGDVDPPWFDEVIPGYFDPALFPVSEEKDDYLLFVGRLTDRKGPHVAAEVAKATGRHLIVAGQGTAPDGAEHVGIIGPERRGELMSRARALLVPSLYVEPFGNVAIEAMACGTPAITTDWGAFTETVIEGVTGFRCRSLAEFVAAVDNAPSISPWACRQHVEGRYSFAVIGEQYERYFQRIKTVEDRGWYALPKEKLQEAAARKIIERAFAETAPSAPAAETPETPV